MPQKEKLAKANELVSNSKTTRHSVLSKLNAFAKAGKLLNTNELNQEIKAKIDEAKALINTLPNGQQKTNLLNELSKVSLLTQAEIDSAKKQVQQVLDAKKQAEQQEKALKEKLAKANELVSNSKTTRHSVLSKLNAFAKAGKLLNTNELNQEIKAKIDEAKALINTLPNGQQKTNLLNELSKVSLLTQAEIDSAKKQVQQVLDAKKQAEQQEKAHQQSENSAILSKVVQADSGIVRNDGWKYGDMLVNADVKIANLSVRDVLVENPLVEQTVDTVFTTLYSEEVRKLLVKLGVELPDINLDIKAQDLLGKDVSRNLLKDYGKSISEDVALSLAKEITKALLLKDLNVHDEWKGLILDFAFDISQAAFQARNNPAVFKALAVQKVSAIALKQNIKLAKKMYEVNRVADGIVEDMAKSIIEYQIGKAQFEFDTAVKTNNPNQTFSYAYESQLEHFSKMFGLSKEAIRDINNEIAEAAYLVHIGKPQDASEKMNLLIQKYPGNFMSQNNLLRDPFSAGLTVVSVNIAEPFIQNFVSNEYEKEALRQKRIQTTSAANSGIYDERDYIRIMSQTLMATHYKSMEEIFNR